jgi:thioredoxin 2
MAAITTCPECGTRNRLPTSVTGRPRCANCHADLAWSVDATDDDFDDAIATKLPVLVDLWAPWCGPCRMVSPAVQQLAAGLAGKLKVVKVNVDESPGISQRYQVQSIPMLLVLQDGKLVDGHIGALPADQLSDWVRAAIG